VPKSVVVLLDNENEGRKLVRALCRQHSVRIGEFEELVQAEIEQTGKQRKKGLWDQFDDILDRMED
jgi:hypothetical protein